MKPYIRGKTIFLREILLDDAEFVLNLRTDAEKGNYLSPTLGGIEKQKEFISYYSESLTDFYFLICDWSWRRLGTIRIYDIREDSFCWGSWILSKDAPKNAAIESALLIYDFAFFALHYSKSHFDVRKENKSVVNFHKHFGARIVLEDSLDYHFGYDITTYLNVRQKYSRFLPKAK